MKCGVCQSCGLKPPFWYQSPAGQQKKPTTPCNHYRSHQLYQQFRQSCHGRTSFPAKIIAENPPPGKQENGVGMIRVAVNYGKVGKNPL